MLKPRVKYTSVIHSAHLCFTSTCLLASAVDISQTLVFLIIIIIIIILYGQHRPSSIPRTLSIEVTISRSNRYVTTAAFPSLSTSPRVPQRRRHTNGEKQKSQNTIPPSVAKILVKARCKRWERKGQSIYYVEVATPLTPMRYTYCTSPAYMPA